MGVLRRPVLHEVGVHLDVTAGPVRLAFPAPGRDTRWTRNPQRLLVRRESDGVDAVVLVRLRDRNGAWPPRVRGQSGRWGCSVQRASPRSTMSVQLRLGDFHVGGQVVVLQHPEAEREIGLLPAERLSLEDRNPDRAGCAAGSRPPVPAAPRIASPAATRPQAPHDSPSASMGVESVPIPSISIWTVWPGLRNSGGSRPDPDPVRGAGGDHVTRVEGHDLDSRRR